MRSPRSEGIVETFICCANGLLAAEGEPSGVEAVEVVEAVIGLRRHHPGIASVAQNVSEAVVVLKDELGLCRESRARCVPVDRVGKIDVEVGDDGTSIPLHVRGRWKVGLLDVLQIGHQCLLR